MKVEYELKRIRYYTLNSWNKSRAPAYNLKVSSVIKDEKLQRKIYELMEGEKLYDEINRMMQRFALAHDYQWQVGFNGRSGGYLVMYRGGYKIHHCYTDEQYKKTDIVYSDLAGWLSKKEASNKGLLNYVWKRVYTQPGLSIENDDVPRDVMKDFDKLAYDIVRHVIRMARKCTVKEEKYKEEKYRITKTRKVIIC